MEEMIQVHGLPINENVFVKKIRVTCKVGTNLVNGLFAYVRRPNKDTYKMNPKAMSLSDRCLLGYSEEEYPKDDLDKLLLKALMTKYATKCTTSFQMFDVDKRDNERLLEHAKIAKLVIHFNFSSPINGENFRSLTFPIYCFISDDAQYFNDAISINVNSEDWLRIVSNSTPIQSLGAFIKNPSKLA